MVKRYLEYREMQQLRKDHLRKQSLRYLLILMAILGVVLAATYMVEAIKPTEPVKSVKPVAAVAPTQNLEDIEEIQDIEEFADIVTKSADKLTSEDLDLLTVKAKDPCYEKNVMLPQEQMMEAIAACKSLK